MVKDLTLLLLFQKDGLIFLKFEVLFLSMPTKAGEEMHEIIFGNY